MKNNRVYISLPIGVEREFMKKQEVFSWEVVKELAMWGYKGVNPFNNGLSRESNRTEHLKQDFKMLLECDRILLCPGYEESDGCQKELAIAVWSGIEVMKYEDFSKNKATKGKNTTE